MEIIAEETAMETNNKLEVEETAEPTETVQQENEVEEVPANLEKKTRVAEIASEDNSTNDSKAEHNGIDNEDSINLTIGEDEAILFTEEVNFLENPLFANKFDANFLINNFVFQVDSNDKSKGKFLQIN